MRTPFLAALVACGLWWLSATAIQAQQESPSKSDQTADQKSHTDRAANQATADQLQQRAKDAANEARDLADQSKAKAREASDLADQARVARERATESAHQGEMKANEQKTQANVGQRVPGVALRSQTIKGMKVHNTAGEDLGRIDDVMVDTETGQIRYAALAVGGFLGIGDKLFAVPWKAFELHQTGQDGLQDYILVVDISKDRLTGANGFDKSQWPAFASKEFENLQAPHTAEKPKETIQK